MGFLEHLFRSFGGHHGRRRHHGHHDDYYDHHYDPHYDPHYRSPNYPPVPAAVVCAKCGVTNAANARFCQGCGAAVAGAQCRKCSAALATGAQFCPQCGQPQ